MLDRTFSTLLTVATTAALLVPAAAAGAPGPPASTGSGEQVERLERVVAKRWGEITRIDGGLRFRASQHDSRLVMTRAGARVRFHDRALRRWLFVPRGCRRVAVETGIAATCRIPAGTSPTAPLLLEIVPRLGDDRIDGSALGAEFRLTLLGDAGRDVLIGGDGSDYFNGAFQGDRAVGNGGDDFIRLGDANDVAYGGPGKDHVVGLAGDDRLFGGDGDDLLEGSEDDDTLIGGPGIDNLRCGLGTDARDNDPDDPASRDCERIAS